MTRQATQPNPTDLLTVVLHSREIARPEADDRYADDGAVLVQLIPPGGVKSTKGDFLMDAEAARLCVEALHAHGTDLPIDFEHQTLGGKWSSPNGRAPAAGWIKSLAFDAKHGLRAAVVWTPDGFDAIETGAYRYLSPVLVRRKTDGRIIALHSAALTNKPAIVGAEPLAASEQMNDFLRELTPMAMGNGVASTPPPDGDGQDASKAGNANDVVAFLAWLRDFLGLGEHAGLGEVKEAVQCLAKIASGEEKTAESQAPLAALSQRVAELEAQIREGHVQSAAEARAQRVERLLQAGDLLEYQRDFAMALTESQLDDYLTTAPTAGKPPVGRTKPPPGPGATGSRAAVAHQASREYDTTEDLHPLCSRDAFVNMKLREAGFEPSIKPGGEVETIV